MGPGDPFSRQPKPSANPTVDDSGAGSSAPNASASWTPPRTSSSSGTAPFWVVPAGAVGGAVVGLTGIAFGVGAALVLVACSALGAALTFALTSARAGRFHPGRAIRALFGDE